MTTKNKAVVRIYGQEYAIVSDDGREHIQRVANLVDDKMKEIAGKNKKLSTAMVAVLAALNMTDDLVRERERSRELQERLDQPDEAVVSLKAQVDSLRGHLQERAMDIDGMEQAAREAEQAMESLRLDLQRKEAAIEERDGRIETGLKEREALEARIGELKNKLMECEVKLVQSRRELQEFMEAFEQ